MSMFKRALHLELTKHKKSAFFLFLILLLSFGLMLFMPSYFTAYTNYDVVGAGMTFLVVFGTPMLAVALAALHAAALRRDPEKSIEDPLPIDPRTRVLASYLSSLIYFFLIAIPLLISYPSFIQMSAYGHMMDNIFALMISSAWWLPLLLLHLLAFSLTYWVKQPLLGAGLALISICFQIGLMMTSVWFLLPWHRLSYYYEWWQLTSTEASIGAVMILFSIILGFRSLLVLAKRIERGVQINLKTATGLIFGLFSGLVISAVVYVIFIKFFNPFY